MSDNGKETRVVDVNGRMIVIKALTDAQLMLMSQMGKTVMNEKAGPQARMAASGTLMDILMSMVVQDDDKAYVSEQIVAGELELSGMTVWVEAFKAEAGEAAPKVTRGRAARTK